MKSSLLCLLGLTVGDFERPPPSCSCADFRNSRELALSWFEQLTPSERTQVVEQHIGLRVRAFGDTPETVANSMLRELRERPAGFFARFTFLSDDEHALITAPATPLAMADALFLARAIPFIHQTVEEVARRQERLRKALGDDDLGAP